MTMFDAMSLAKLYYSAMTGKMLASDIEKEAACRALKQMAEQRWDWTNEQKEFYKLMVDFVKEQSQGEQSV